MTKVPHFSFRGRERGRERERERERERGREGERERGREGERELQFKIGLDPYCIRIRNAE